MSQLKLLDESVDLRGRDTIGVRLATPPPDEILNSAANRPSDDIGNRDDLTIGPRVSQFTSAGTDARSEPRWPALAAVVPRDARYTLLPTRPHRRVGDNAANRNVGELMTPACAVGFVIARVTRVYNGLGLRCPGEPTTPRMPTYHRSEQGRPF